MGSDLSSVRSSGMVLTWYNVINTTISVGVKARCFFKL